MTSIDTHTTSSMIIERARGSCHKILRSSQSLKRASCRDETILEHTFGVVVVLRKQQLQPKAAASRDLGPAYPSSLLLAPRLCTQQQQCLCLTAMSGRPPPSGRYSDDDSFSSPDRSRPVPRRTPLYRDPPPAHSGRRRRPRGRGYSLPREKSRHRGSSRHETTLRLCVFDQTNHSWRTAVLKFDPHRATDQDVWHDVRRIYRDELQKFWRRVLGFKKLKSIAPIEVCAPLTLNSMSTLGTSDEGAVIDARISTPPMAYPKKQMTKIYPSPTPSCTATIIHPTSSLITIGLTGSSSSTSHVRASPTASSSRRACGLRNWL